MSTRGVLCAWPGILLVLCGLAAGTLGTEQHTFHKAADMDDLLPPSDPVFQEADISDLDCARVCDNHPDCLAFSFIGDPKGSCYGYTSSMALNAINGTTVRGAKTNIMTATTGPKRCHAQVVSAQSAGIIQLSLDASTFCDGPWLVFQRRQNGRVDFKRDWEAYRNGFGDAEEFWLGLEAVRELTSQDTWDLRVDLEDKTGTFTYASYSSFRLGSEANFYPLMCDSYTGGTAGDSLIVQHRGQPFTTIDRDHDSYPSNCAAVYHGGWWYSGCHEANLNGDYNNDLYGEGLNWLSWKGHMYSLRFSEMKIQKA